MVRPFHANIGCSTVSIDVNTADASDATQVPGPGTAVRVLYEGDDGMLCFINVGEDATLADPETPNGGDPGTASVGIPILANVAEVFTMPADGWVKVYAASGSGIIYFTRGEGV